MAQIFIELKPIYDVPNPINHLYLVYQADDGREWVVRAGYSSNPALSPFTFEINVPVQDSSDARVDLLGNPQSPSDRYSTPLSFGSTADEAWNLIVKYALELQNSNLLYSAIGLNSNRRRRAFHRCGSRSEPGTRMPTG
jgi:hypothetical protein